MLKDDNEQAIVDFAGIASDNELIHEIVDKMDQAISKNNSGLFRIAELLLNELIKRRPDLADSPKMVEFRKDLREGIAKTGRHGD